MNALRLPPRALAGLLLIALAVGLAVSSAPTRAQQRPNLSEVLLRADDLPAGWTALDLPDLGLNQLGPGALSGFDLADLDVDTTGPCGMALAPLFAIGRVQPPTAGLALFHRGPAGPFLVHVVIALPPALAEAFVNLANPMIVDAITAACRDELLEDAPVTGGFDIQSALASGGFSVTNTPLKLPPIGDQSLVARTDITVGFLGASLLSATSRRGGTVSMIALLADPNSATLAAGLIEQLARTADARMLAAFGGR